MDKKTLEEIFNRLWGKYLDLEREIWRLGAVYEASPTEDLKEGVNNLCQIALGQLGELENMSSYIYNGQILSNFQNGCREKRNYLHEINSNIMTERQR